MSIVTLPLALLTIVFGFILGYIPGLNEHLHWNLWYVVPISGLIFGGFVGWVQFGYCFKTNEKLSTFLMIHLSVMALFGYSAVDYGIYKSIVVEVEDVEGIEDGQYKLAELISFWQYMKINLVGSKVDSQYGTDGFEMGSVGTTISYLADLLGAGLGAVGMLYFCSQKYPYCVPCRKYKEREQRYDVQFKYGDSLNEQIFGGIHEKIAEGSYQDVVAYLQALGAKHTDRKGNMKISVDHRFCPSCFEGTILGKVHRKSGGDWTEVEDLNFRLDSQPGELANQKT
jgi:hypothetical protein